MAQNLNSNLDMDSENDFFDEDFYEDDAMGFFDNEAFAESDGICVSIDLSDDFEVMDAEVSRDLDDETVQESEKLAQMIDHTNLKPDSTVDQITSLCLEAKKHHFKSVCVNSAWVRLCAELLRGSDVEVCSVVGFPLGAMIPEAKAMEAEMAIENGATEIDMVMNIGALKSKDYRLVSKDIAGVIKIAHSHNVLVKVIIETCLLTDEEKKIACLIAKALGADFVKTSTGFSTGGATEADVKLMRETVGDEMGVKASGGIRTSEDAKKMIKAGASRIGASASIKIIDAKEK
jgi:deoxyribose-phosphate aldolase